MLSVLSPLVSQYAPHLYCNTPSICIAVLLGHFWWLWSPGCSPRHTHTQKLRHSMLLPETRVLFSHICDKATKQQRHHKTRRHHEDSHFEAFSWIWRTVKAEISLSGFWSKNSFENRGIFFADFRWIFSYLFFPGKWPEIHKNPQKMHRGNQTPKPTSNFMEGMSLKNRCQSECTAVGSNAAANANANSGAPREVAKEFWPPNLKRKAAN